MPLPAARAPEQCSDRARRAPRPPPRCRAGSRAREAAYPTVRCRRLRWDRAMGRRALVASGQGTCALRKRLAAEPTTPRIARLASRHKGAVPEGFAARRPGNRGTPSPRMGAAQSPEVGSMWFTVVMVAFAMLAIVLLVASQTRQEVHGDPDMGRGRSPKPDGR